MNTNTLFPDVRSEISDIFKILPERVTPEAHFVEDLKLDSQDMHQLAMALEEILSTEIPDEDLYKLRTVGELVDYLSTKAKSQCVPQGS
jgi:acyl carrier protein